MRLKEETSQPQCFWLCLSFVRHLVIIHEEDFAWLIPKIRPAHGQPIVIWVHHHGAKLARRYANPGVEIAVYFAVPAMIGYGKMRQFRVSSDGLIQPLYV